AGVVLAIFAAAAAVAGIVCTFLGSRPGEDRSPVAGSAGSQAHREGVASVSATALCVTGGLIVLSTFLPWYHYALGCQSASRSAWALDTWIVKTHAGERLLFEGWIVAIGGALVATTGWMLRRVDWSTASARQHRLVVFIGVAGAGLALCPTLYDLF